MLDIPKSFFQEENRLGFYVSESMKKNWAVQLTMISEILEIADRHGIKVWMDYGSLLGAVRHHGFIPWDDDVDICVMRKDFLPLIQHLQKELPPYRVIESAYTDLTSSDPKAVVISRKIVDIGNDPAEKEITDLNYGFTCKSFIDLYPMDYVPEDPKLWDTIKNLSQVIEGLGYRMDEYISSGEFESYLSQIEELTGMKAPRDGNLLNSIWIMADKVSSMTTKKESNKVIWYPDIVNKNIQPRPVSLYSKTLFIEFEMLKVPIPCGYDAILRSVYGDKYYVPVKSTAVHDYPHFANQERVILSYSQIGQLGDIFL